MTWSWQRDLTLPLGQALMESLWLYTVVVAAGALHPVPLRVSLSAFLGLSLGVVLTTKGGAHAARRSWLRLPLQVCLAVVALIGWVYWVLGAGLPSTADAPLTLFMEPWRVRPAVTPFYLALTWGIGLYLTCRGLLIGTQALTGRTVGRWMIVGVGVLLFVFACLALPAVSSTRLPVSELRYLVLSYFVVGLATMSLGHRQVTQQGSGLRPQVSFAWLLAIALPILAIGSVGTLLVSGRTTARAALGLLAQLTVWLVALLGSTLSFLLDGIVWLLRQLATLFPAGGSARPDPVGSIPLSLPPDPPRFQRPTLALPGAELDVGLAIGALAVLATFVYLCALNRARASVSGSTLEEGSSSAWSWALARRQLVQAWESLLGSLRNRVGRTAMRLTALRPRRREALGDIRQIYRALLRWAAERGLERPLSATPHEFAAQLARTAVHAEKHIVLITTSYAQARYGTTALDEAELHQATQSIRSLLSGVSEP